MSRLTRKNTIENADGIKPFYFLGECNCVSIGEWIKSEVGCE